MERDQASSTRGRRNRNRSRSKKGDAGQEQRDSGDASRGGRHGNRRRKSPRGAREESAATAPSGQEDGGRWPRGKQQQQQQQHQGNRNHGQQTGRRKKKAQFKEHLSREELEKGLEAGDFMKGDFRVNAHRRVEAYVTVEGEPRDIMINSTTRQNRAFHGDVVVLRIVEDEKKKGQEEQAAQEEQQPEEPKTKRKRNKKKKQEEEEPVEQLSSAVANLSVADSGEEGEEAEEEAEEFPRKQGVVVGIWKAKPQAEFVGHLQSTREGSGDLKADENYAFFVPTDAYAPRFLVKLGYALKKVIGKEHRSSEEMERILTQGVFVCAAEDWDNTMRHPRGNLKKLLGFAGEKVTEFDALRTGNHIDFDAEFSEECTRDLPGEDWQIPQAEIALRRDLRSERIFSIDPPTAKDLDDALHCKRLADGNFEIGVHIADVSHFVTVGGALDKEAARRATTVYFVTHNIPMLPRVLCDNLCSLVVGVDRLSFSVIWTISPQAEVLTTWFGKTIMRSRAQLDYGTAQEMEDNPQNFDSDPELQACAKDVMALQKLADIMRKRRFNSGSLSLDSVKLSFELDEDENPISVKEYERHGSHFLVEEFMLLANTSVAEKIYGAAPYNSLLRRHEAPVKGKLESFVEEVRGFGFDLDTHSSLALHRSLEKLQKKADPLISSTILWLATKPMQTAKYTQTEATLGPEHYHHFGLNFGFYTHFTSPIRRYADLMVHRILHSVTTGQKPPYSANFIANVCQTCNDRKSASDRAQDQCDLLFLTLLLKRQGRIETKGVVAEKGDTAMTIYCPIYGVDKRIYYEDLHPSRVRQRGNGATELIWMPRKPGDEEEERLRAEQKKKEEEQKKQQKGKRKRKRKQKADDSEIPEVTSGAAKSVMVAVGDVLDVVLLPLPNRKLTVGMELNLNA